MAEVQDSHGISMDTGNSQTNWSGMGFLTKVACTFKQCTKESSCTATKAMLLNSSQSILEEVSFSGNVATFNTSLSDATNYGIVVDSDGSSYTRRYKGQTGVLPITGTNINWVGSSGNGDAPTSEDYVFSVVSVTTATSTTETITKTGNARIQINDTELTKTGNARIQINDTEEVYDGDARLEVSGLQITKEGTARLEVSGLQITKEGNASLNFVKEITGNASIAVSGLQITKTGNARVAVPFQKTSTGNARIEVSDNEITKEGNARIEVSDNEITKEGNASLRLPTVQKIITGNASILISDTFIPKVKIVESIKPIIKSIETFN